MSFGEVVCTYSERANLLERIEKWRAHRAELVAAGNGPVRLAGAATMLFHVIPAGSLTRRVLQEPWHISEEEKHQVYVPHRGTNCSYNADGFLCSTGAGDEAGAYGYTQLFRSGIVEYADSNCCGPVKGTESMILGQSIEAEMVRCYEDAIRRIHKEGWKESVYAGFSLIGLANKVFFSTYRRLALGLTGRGVDNIFNSPEVLVDINTPEESPYSRTLLPLVDTMWQVAGLPGTPFKPKGEWNPFGRYD